MVQSAEMGVLQTSTLNLFIFPRAPGPPPEKVAGVGLGGLTTS